MPQQRTWGLLGPSTGCWGTEGGQAALPTTHPQQCPVDGPLEAGPAPEDLLAMLGLRTHQQKEENVVENFRVGVGSETMMQEMPRHQMRLKGESIIGVKKVTL